MLGKVDYQATPICPFEGLGLPGIGLGLVDPPAFFLANTSIGDFVHSQLSIGLETFLGIWAHFFEHGHFCAYSKKKSFGTCLHNQVPHTIIVEVTTKPVFHDIFLT